MSYIKLPSLIDLHVHLRDPGQTWKEDFSTGTAAAVAGGFVLVCDMPNNAHLIDSMDTWREKEKIAKKKIHCDLGVYAGTMGDNLSALGKLKHIAPGLKIYLNETTGGFFTHPDQLMSIFSAWSCQKPILCHAETEMIDHVIDVVRKTGQKTHICHVSLKEELERIIRAKEEHLPISCGVTPHHLFLTERDLSRLGSYGRMKPPLAQEEDRLFLWEHLDMIDVVESDHAPHTREEKDSLHPPYGVPGLETTLPLLLTGVYEKKMQLEDVIRLLHIGPSQILGISLPSDTYTEVDVSKEYMLDESRLQTKCSWSPFSHIKLRGKISSVVIRGKTVYDGERLCIPPGWGNIL